MRLTLLALHAGLTTDEQLRVFEPAERGSRKVIISTNIAEVPAAFSSQSKLLLMSQQASVTIEGIKFVVDSGFAKVGRSSILSTTPGLTCGPDPYI